MARGKGASPHDPQVLAVNGTKVDNLKHLVQLVESGSKDPQVKLELEYNQVLVLDRDEALKSTKDVLATHFIPSDRSEDLL